MSKTFEKASLDLVNTVYLEKSGNRLRLVMPDEGGGFPDSVKRKRTGFAIQWPVNPHATGESMILQVLNGQEAQAALGKEVYCNGFIRDQDGRFWKAY